MQGADMADVARRAVRLCGAGFLAVGLLSVAPPAAEAQTLKDLQERRQEQRGATTPDRAPGAVDGEDPSAEPSKPKLSPERQLELAYENLRSQEEAVWKAAQDKIAKSWSRSGSASMDLLLQRGRAAIQREDWEAAADHLTDLVNLAPEFAEGWNARASVYYRQKKLGPALADLAEAVARDPRHYRRLCRAGRDLRAVGRPTERDRGLSRRAGDPPQSGDGARRGETAFRPSRRTPRLTRPRRPHPRRASGLGI